jgi:hypothetical protein
MKIFNLKKFKIYGIALRAKVNAIRGKFQRKFIFFHCRSRLAIFIKKNERRLQHKVHHVKVATNLASGVFVKAVPHLLKATFDEAGADAYC